LASQQWNGFRNEWAGKVNDEDRLCFLKGLSRECVNSFSNSKLKSHHILHEDLVSHSTWNIVMHLTFESSRNWLLGREEPTCELGAANKCHKVKGGECGKQKVMKPQVLQVKGCISVTPADQQRHHRTQITGFRSWQIVCS
jgi:hypothetical protein